MGFRSVQPGTDQSETFFVWRTQLAYVRDADRHAETIVNCDRNGRIIRAGPGRKRPKEGLQRRVELQEQLIHLAASVPGLIYSFQLRPDGSTRMPYASGALKDIFVLNVGDVAEDATPAFSMIHADDIGRVNASIAESARTMHPWRSEFRVRRHGRLGNIWIEAHSVPQREPDGSILWHGFLQDITERKLTADALREARADLSESERRFRDLLDNVDLVAVMCDRDEQVTYCNDYLCRLTGWRREEIVGRNWIELFVPPDNAEQNRTSFAAILLNAPDARHHESEIVTRSGERRLIRWNNSVLRSGAGGVTGTASIGEDITEQTRAEMRIRRVNRVYSMLSGINALIVRVQSPDELFREACRIAVELGGFCMSLVCIVGGGGRITPVASAGKSEGLLVAITNALSSPATAAKTMVAQAIRHKTALVANDSQSDSRVMFGREYADFGVRSMAIMPLVVSDRAVGVFALYATELDFFDKDEMTLLLELSGDIGFAMGYADQQARLDYLAHYDPLTGLANRSLFLEKVAQHIHSAAAGGQTLAVILIDLERFKSLNDSLGRPAGDALLRQVAAWLTRNAGDATLLARLDADHFAAVLLDDRRGGDFTRVLERTLDAFRSHEFRLDDAVFRLAVKVGMAVFPADGVEADTLFTNAEAALKKAKAGGERYLSYTQTMTAAAAGRLTLETQLRQALDNEEFVLHYQPKVNLASGKMTGAEALIRWNNPRMGLMAPARFIPILEETGLIYDVGRWALRKAVGDYLRWRAAGLAAVRISVNVSSLQLAHRGFIAEIEQAIGVDPHAASGLELEMTESLIMADVALSIASLRTIRALGVTIAIDDFGTGFSSLSYLAKLPVNTLKIDHSFIIDMTAGPEGLALVSTIINLAHAIRLTVVAEGVETEEQSRLLRLLGCDEMQGYLFSRPVPVDVFETQFLAAQSGMTARSGPA